MLVKHRHMACLERPKRAASQVNVVQVNVDVQLLVDFWLTGNCVDDYCRFATDNTGRGQKPDTQQLRLGSQLNWQGWQAQWGSNDSNEVASHHGTFHWH